MKIGFDAKRAFHNKTGLGNYSRSVIQSIAKIRDTDQLYLMTPSLNKQNFNIKNTNINIVQPSLYINKIYWRSKGMNKHLNNNSIDIYHGLSNELPHGITVKSVVTIHDLLFLKYPQFYNYFDRNIYYIKSKIACQSANKIIATSQQTKKDIINFFNIPEEKIQVIYQTCQPEFIHGPNKSKVNKQLIKNIQEPFILYVGSIEKRKNLIFLLQAIVKMKKEIKLICVGKKYSYYKKVKNFINLNKLSKRVTFLNVNNTDTLALLYKKSRALIYPSINEGFGIPIIEAMYSKIPVITSNKAIFKEIGGENSYYFEEGKLDSLIEKITNTWTDSQNRDDKVQINFKYVQKFNEDQQAYNIIDLYKNLVNHGS